jgi:hypothetical protein
MKERPILFSAPMIRAILAGTKTQTRRVVKPQPEHPHFGGRAPLMLALDDEGIELYLHSRVLAQAIRCPYGKVGDRLWVRETFLDLGAIYLYRAEAHAEDERALVARGQPWRPAIHMPRAASRITLEVTEVRVERLQHISEADAIAEGVNVHPDHHGKPQTSLYSPVQAYRDLWEQINGLGSWEANPWVWSVHFKRL